LSMALLPQEEDRQLVGALHEYRNGHYAAALEQWPESHVGTRDDLLNLIRAHCLSELGDERFVAQQALIADRRSAEVAALNVIYHFRRGSPGVAASYFSAIFGHLQKSPWVLNLMVEPALDLALDVATRAPQESRIWQPLLAERFAEWRYESRRLVQRVFVADALQSPDLIEALGACEPNPEWERCFLEIRERAYSAAGDPRGGAARKDLENYRQREQSR
jgi:hypothetical protein